MVHGGDERRLQIERLCEAALARPVETRAQFLRLACGDDVGLHREVEALLVHASAIDRFPEQPLDAVAAGVMTDVSGDATQSGARAGGGLGEIDGSLTDRRLGTFEIGKLLGVGGMDI